MDEQVRFYAKTFGGTVFVTKDGEIVYALPHIISEGGVLSEEPGVRSFGLDDRRYTHGSRIAEGRGRDVPAGASPSQHAAWYPMGSGAAGWNGQSPLVRAGSESEANVALVWAYGYMPFFHADDVDCQPERSFTNVILAAYIPGLQRETSHRDVSTFTPTVGNVLYDDIKNESPNRRSTQNSKLPTPNSKLRSVALKERLIGSKINEIKGSAQSATAVSYFKGSAPSKWRSNIATYEMVDMGEVYDGICLRLKAHGDNVEKLFTVKPGADAGQIRIRLDGIKSSPVSVEAHGNVSLCGQQALFEGEKQPPESPFIKGDLAKSPSEKGAMGLSVNERGELVAGTELGPVTFTKPVAYQEIDGKRVEVAVEYRLQEPEIGGEGCLGAGKQGGRGEPETLNSQLETRNSKLTYGFTVASYDKTKDLIIDPLLASTFLGGFSWDCGYSLTLDTSGNVYVTGKAMSFDFPTTSGAYDTSYNSGGSDVFVSKLDSGLTSLLASTFLGGSNSEGGNSLALDASGNIYVTGYTKSSDFPTTRGAYDTSFNGVTQYATDVFVSKLNSGLTSLLASTFLGVGWSSSLTLDASGNIYVTGEAVPSFPTTNDAYDTSFNGNSDVFVSKLDSGLTSLLASTFLGGSSWEYGKSLSLDASGNVYVTGKTWSSDFPTTKGAYDTSPNGTDAFVSKLDSGLASLLASTFLGGNCEEFGNSLTLDASGNVYVTGETCSPDFPTTFGAYDTFNDIYDAFVSKLDSGLTSLLASTFLGGYTEDGGSSLTLDASGNVYVTGHTHSYDFPVTNGAYDTSYNGSSDVFVSKLNSGLKELLASTFLGGPSRNWDWGESIALDTSGNVYVTGNTCSPDFPTTRGAYDTSFNSVYYNPDVFVSKLDGNLSADISCTYSISPTRQSFSSSGGTGSVGVTVSSGTCSWTAVSKAAWITITSGDSGTGNGTVAYSVSANTGTSARTGTMTIAGQTFKVIEYGLACTAESITATPKKLILRKGINDTVTITVKGYSDCPVEGVAVTATIYGKGKRLIDVSPSSQETDANGQAVFSISAKDKKGTAVLKFKASGLDKVATVQVKVR